MTVTTSTSRARAVLPAQRGQAGVRSQSSQSLGFTLVELMVTVAIIGVLLSLLAPALQRTIGSARGFKCQAALRNVAFDFALFADPAIHPSRGVDTQYGNRFRLSTFQESEYGIDEFWSHGDQAQITVEAGESLDHMRCAEIAGAITIRQNLPCTTAGSIGPAQNVSYGFNARLSRSEKPNEFGFFSSQPIFLNSEILESPDVPLVWDVDGAAAIANGLPSPLFSAPTMNNLPVFPNNRYWFPGKRHNGSVNVAFIGGHVLSSRQPLEEAGWQWGFAPN